MKKFNTLWLPLMAALLITACSGGDKSNADAPSAEMETVAPPIASFISEYEDGSAQDGTVTSYKLCRVNQPGYDAALMFLYNRDKKQLAYNAQKETEALEAGKPFKNTWSSLRSAALVNVCPAGADGRCEVSNFITSYYTTSPKLLAHFKKNCAGLPKNVWTDKP